MAYAAMAPPDPNGTHPLEVWTGINFGIASYYRLMGETGTALAITSAVVNQVYTGGLQFRTPEAITAVNTFRACHYLRAMAIWGVWATHTDWQPIPGRNGTEPQTSATPVAIAVRIHAVMGSISASEARRRWH